jgi:electron transport complex protein RnfA
VTYIGIIITFVFLNNFVFSMFLGICPLIGLSGNRNAAAGLGFAVVLTSSLAALATWAVYHVLLEPLGLVYLQTFTFILTISGLVQFLDLLIRSISPALYRTLGVYMPLLMTNCAVLGITLIAVRSRYTALESLAAGFAAGVGFYMAVVLLSTLRDSLRREWVPKPFQGIPITFISAGLMALAFMAFDTALLKNLIK